MYESASNEISPIIDLFQFYIPSTIPYLLILAVLLSGICLLLKYAKKTVLSYLVACLGYGAIAIFAALLLKLDGFDFIRLLALGAFVGGFLLFAIFAAFSAAKFKLLSKFFIGLCVIIVLIGVDAFLIEPRWLEIDRTTLQSAKIKHPIRLAILSDLQTRKVGDYEKDSIQKMLAEKPDLILFPGDYVQSDGSASRITSRQNEIRRLNELFRNEKLAAPLGIFAVHGNVEDDSSARNVFGFAKSHMFYQDRQRRAQGFRNYRSHTRGFIRSKLPNKT